MGNICCPATSESNVVVTEQLKDQSATTEDLVDLLITRTPSGVQDRLGATINLDLLETILIQDDYANSNSDDAMSKTLSKPGDALSIAQIADLVDQAEKDCKITYDNSPLEDLQKKCLPEGRKVYRKGTGFVTKAKLLEALGEISDDEEDAIKGGAKAVAEPEPVPMGAARKAMRKGTAKVTKSKLQKAYDKLKVAEDE